MPLDIPEVVIDRLPVYYRLLSRLHRENISVISSQELGDHLGVTPAQIRKDLSYFGRFGKQGRGYSVERLIEELQSILGLDRSWRMVLVGVGQLGRAIATYRGFAPAGFDLVAAYDAHPDQVQIDDGPTVRPIDQLPADLRAEHADIGIVAVPAAEAQEVIDMLVSGGVQAILNYAPRTVQVPENVHVRRIDPVVALQSMTYHLSRDRD